jgi:hypothetical protein
MPRHESITALLTRAGYNTVFGEAASNENSDFNFLYFALLTFDYNTFYAHHYIIQSSTQKKRKHSDEILKE